MAIDVVKDDNKISEVMIPCTGIRFERTDKGRWWLGVFEDGRRTCFEFKIVRGEIVVNQLGNEWEGAVTMEPKEIIRYLLTGQHPIDGELMSGQPRVLSSFRQDAKDFGGSDVIRCAISRKFYDRLMLEYDK